MQLTAAWQFLIPALTALIAGCAALLVVVLSKEQKVSEFRQNWIDSLRAEISEFVAVNLSRLDALNTMAHLDINNQEIANSLNIEKYREIISIETSRTKILLRLNSNEHSEIINLITSIYSPNIHSRHKDKDQREIIDELIAESQKMLKNEWKRVKSGEPAFKKISTVSSWLIVLALIALVSIPVYSYFFPPTTGGW